MGKTGADARQRVGLKCSKCSFMIRHTEKNTKNTTDKLELNKYCPKCKSVQVFKEAKIGK